MKALKSTAVVGATIIVVSSVFCSSAMAIGEAAGSLQTQWDVIKYQTAEKDRESAFEALAEKAKLVESAHPSDAEVLVWEAIILSSYAGEKGGFGALKLVKKAKSLLEQAEKIDPNVLSGSVYTSLGSLYYQVPGWPIGFGDDDKAQEYLEKALLVAPDDIDANYFYGDFLVENGDPARAVPVLEKALNSPARPGREIADAGRKAEVQQLLEKAKNGR